MEYIRINRPTKMKVYSVTKEGLTRHVLYTQKNTALLVAYPIQDIPEGLNRMKTLYTSNGKTHNSGFEHNSRTENKSNTGFYLFLFILGITACGLVGFFLPYLAG